MVHAHYPDGDSATAQYARRFSGSVGLALLDRQSTLVREAVSGFAASRSGGLRVLDVGGGHGQIVAALRGVSSTTTEVLSSTTEAIGEVMPLVTEGVVRAHVGALDRSGLGDHSFDVVTCVRQLPHVSDWKALIAELCRLSSGIVVVDYPPKVSSNILYSLLFPLKRRMEGDTRTFRIFSHNEIQREFEVHGFSLVRRQGQFLFPLVLYRALKSAVLMHALELPGAVTGLRSLFGNPTVAVFARR